MQILTQAFCVAMGSIVGGLLRWSVSVLFGRLGTSFPWGTFVINITSCVFLGWFLETHKRWVNDLGWITRDNFRLLVAVGFTGTYSTFSTFEYESSELISDEQFMMATAYMIGSVVLGLLAVRIGTRLA